jgi:hypothetical protein
VPVAVRVTTCFGVGILSGCRFFGFQRARLKNGGRAGCARLGLRHSFRVELRDLTMHPITMNKVEQIQAELEKLSSTDLDRVREWLDDFVEDRLEFAPEFEAAIQESEREMAAGLRPRLRRP